VSIELNPIEARVMGCLLEKSVVTPDQYPLTLNALTNACNQKSSREPVMSLNPGEVQHAVRALQDKHLMRSDENFKTQVEKYSHRLCNTPFSDFQFDPPQFSIICVLLLRGPRTPGELRANSGRLHTFEDNDAVVNALQELMHREEGAVVVELPRSPGRKDPQYMHLLSGEVDTAVHNTPTVPERAMPPATVATEETPPDHGLTARVTRLEAEVAELRAILSSNIEASKN
jgi:uncharacterized protein YceH (UPF0502 family)